MTGLVWEDFEGRVGEVFTLAEEGFPPLPLTLDFARLLSPTGGLPGVRPPFSLIFLSPEDGVLPQKLYRMSHEAMGELELFIVPVAKDARGVHYQATFN